MISRRTIFSLVLAVLVLLALRVWVQNHRDPCRELLGVHNTFPASVYVESGTRTVEMPCNVWLMRQPTGVQIVCLLDLVLGVTVLLSMWGDRAKWKQARRT